MSKWQIVEDQNRVRRARFGRFVSTANITQCPDVSQHPVALDRLLNAAIWLIGRMKKQTTSRQGDIFWRTHDSRCAATCSSVIGVVSITTAS